MWSLGYVQVPEVKENSCSSITSSGILTPVNTITENQFFSVSSKTDSSSSACEQDEQSAPKLETQPSELDDFVFIDSSSLKDPNPARAVLKPGTLFFKNL